jgi:hypothetical protein
MTTFGKGKSGSSAVLAPSFLSTMADLRDFCLELWYTLVYLTLVR